MRVIGEADMKKQKNIGYYYCSLSTFFNIIKNHSVFLSDPLQMNDTDEITWVCKHMPRSDDESLKHVKAESEKASKYIHEHGQNNIFIGSYSKGEDILSQWRGYGNDGRGVSIGFDLHLMCERNARLTLKDVRYRTTIKKSDMQSWASILHSAEEMGRSARHIDNPPTLYACNEAAALASANDNMSDSDPYKPILNRMLPELATYKSACFKEEMEMRLIYKEDVRLERLISRINGDEQKYLDSALYHDFRTVAADYVTEYVILPFKEDEIVSVCTGPKCGWSIDDIKKWLEVFFPNNKIKVTKSKASYR